MDTKLTIKQTLFVVSFQVLVILGYFYVEFLKVLEILNGIATIIWAVLVLYSLYYYNVISTGYDSLHSRKVHVLEKFLFAVHNLTYIVLTYLFYSQHMFGSMYATAASIVFIWIITYLEYTLNEANY